MAAPGITALLGHNGAGKTTTMSILTGLFPPTSGTAIVNGYDIRTDIKRVREGLGICPQHNVLFEKLTVREHLWFCAKLRRMPDAEARTRITTAIADVGLQAKAEAQASSLSGGQKRKLSVAMAFLCGKHTVILDEPTAGMDPSARRATWDLLLRYKKTCTILLCTHHLDEADLLSDNICIMAHGKLQCCGSSLFLKRAYAASYVLSVEMDRSRGATAAPLLHAVQQNVPVATLADDVGQEVTIQLPADNTAAFSAMLRHLETLRGDLGVLSYGMSATTLEDVFLKVAERAEELEDDGAGSPARTAAPIARTTIAGRRSTGAVDTTLFASEIGNESTDERDGAPLVRQNSTSVNNGGNSTGSAATGASSRQSVWSWTAMKRQNGSAAPANLDISLAPVSHDGSYTGVPLTGRCGV